MKKLIHCKACDGLISRKARACPHCGQPHKGKLFGYRRVIIIIMAILYVAFHEGIHDTLRIPDPVDYIIHKLLGISENE